MEAIFLACFAFGAVFTLLTTLLGIAGAGLHGVGSHLHLPGNVGHGAGHGFGHGAVNSLSHGAHGLGDAAHAAHHAVHGATHGPGHLGPMGHATPFVTLALGMLLNPSALLVGISTFGGLGYIALHYLLWPLLYALAIAVPGGLGGTAIVGAFIAKLRQDAGTMHDHDYALAGTLATVTVTIAEGRAGEVVFVMGGVRRAEGARSLGGSAIAKGTQVVILGFERGLVMVEPATTVTESLKAPEHNLEAPRRSQEQADELG